ncbi:MAG: hypothetical protein NTW96_24700 [Planctomycetia bacterium]|nr:hypothetical protein [Planctomycetia bacterium]
MKTLPTIAQTEVAYDTAQAKQNELRSSRDAVETTLAGAATLRTDTGQQAIALLDGPGDEDEPTVDREALEREAEILDRAIQVNEQRVLEAARAHGAAMYTARQPVEHIRGAGDQDHRSPLAAVLPSARNPRHSPPSQRRAIPA